jgi:N-acetylmuramoyl-L-alanine amidase
MGLEARHSTMRKKLTCIFLGILFLASFSLGISVTAGKTSGKPQLLLNEASLCRKGLVNSPQKKKFRHNWFECIHRYEKVYTRYPKSDEAVRAMYRSARLFTGLYVYSGLEKDLDKAIDLYRRIIEEHKSHRLADDAQYRIGEIYYRYKKDPAQAYVEFLKVDVRFPSGDMLPKAKQKLDKLAVVLSKKDVEKKRSDKDISGSMPVSVTDMRHWSTPNYTRVVVDLNGPVKYKAHLLKADPDLKKPRRLYLDLKDTRVTSQIDSRIPIKDELLRSARAGQYNKDTVRVVLDMESVGGYEVFHLYDPFRIVMDVRKIEESDTKESIKRFPAGRSPRSGIKKAKVQDEKVSLARQLGLNVGRVLIDPGHGGRDTGCLFGRNIQEKDIVLRVAKLLARKLKKDIGCEVLLTRTGDTFLPLERRTAIANMEKVDLFVSLHVNAHRNKRIWGIETYFLNMATDETSVMVAARENATSEKNISDLQTILNDLMLNTKIHESSRLAQEIQKRIVFRVSRSYKPYRSLGVKQAPFYVLIGAQMPSVLVEMGFLTNARERKRLLSNKYQEAMAEGIFEGIRGYIKGIDQAYRGG